MELDKLRKLEQEPPLSGAYMRSLVKQLAKDSMNPKDQNCVMNLSKHGKVVAQQQSTELPQQQQHKKQVRRRLHTSKPYQERLLNMAEARREIVTALKFHRAAMKEASKQQQQQQQQQHHHHHHHQQQQQVHPLPLVPNSYTWHAASPIAQPHLMVENPNFILPNQTLGLNLNFHDFNNLDATVHLSNASSSSPSSYSSGTSSSSSQEVLPSVGKSQVEGFPSIEFNAATQQVTGGLHTAMDDEGMAEIRSLGDQYQMEWNDTMNLVKSACWFKYLKNMEHDAAPEVKGEDYAYRDFDQFLEFPTWLNANESCLEQCSEDYFHDSTLPCMDIGDIDGMDDDWLA